MSIETKPVSSVEAMAGAGFSDWHRAARQIGNRALASLTSKLDPGDRFGVNSHHAITTNIEAIGLPVQSYVTPGVSEFLTHPEEYFDLIPQGDYYFVSIKPGTHLAHEREPSEVIRFVESYLQQHPGDTEQELYLSHNGDPLLSGHIVIRDDGVPNSLYSEFTVGNFNAFHRGSHAPEIIVQRAFNTFSWDFRDSLQAQEQHWRTEDTFPTYTGVCLSRLDIAQRVYDAIRHIPHDDDYYLPGYYEVLLERTVETATKASFIDAQIGRAAIAAF